MGAISEEVRVWNTPVVGAFLLWHFTKGYTNNHPLGEAPIGLLHFIAGGILTSPALMEMVSNRRADLQSYVRGFEDKTAFDQLLSIHERISDNKEFVLASIDVAVSQGLLFWDQETGRLYWKEQAKSPRRGNQIKSSMKSLANKAEILGKWFVEHDLRTITRYLKVVL